MSAPTEPDESTPATQTEPKLTQRQMLATYLGFDEAPPLRSKWWVDALWIFPADLALVYVVLTSSRNDKPMALIALAVFSLITYMTATRVRFVQRLEQRDRDQRGGFDRGD